MTTPTPTGKIPKDLQVIKDQTDLRIMEMEKQIELANNLQKLAPVVNEVLSVVNNLANYSYSLKQQILSVEDNRHRREQIVSVLKPELEGLQALQMMLVERIGLNKEDGKDEVLGLLRESMTERSKLVQYLVSKL
jgi:hypothetical protein